MHKQTYEVGGNVQTSRESHAEAFAFVQDWLTKYETYVTNVSIKIDTNSVGWKVSIHYTWKQAHDGS